MNYTNSDALSRPIGATVDLPAVMRQVYAWMFLGLLLTTGVSLFVASQPALQQVIRNPIVLIGFFIAELGLVWYLAARIMKMSPGTATTMFLVYSALNGATLSFIFLAYTRESIASAFIATCATFGVVSLFGYVTKIDLSKMGSILIVALIGLIIATIVNIFLRSSALMMAVNYAGVLIFVGLTAYDTQKIKSMAENVSAGSYRVSGFDANGTAVVQGVADAALVQRIAIYGALTLYLDFINLFLFILRIMGSGSRR